jgi:hypothetical protein
MTPQRLVRPSQRPPGEQVSPGPWLDVPARGMRPGICCHGETVAPIQRQFQFRNLSDDPRLNLRLAGILISGRGTD